jgi:uncharacterized protein
MAGETIAPRLRRLPTAELCGRRVRVATGPRARLLGLAYLERREAGLGLLIPNCSSVHTFGMRFALDIVFLDGLGMPLTAYCDVSHRRFVCNLRAAAVLELPSPALIPA